jgi:hypothetical protein
MLETTSPMAPVARGPHLAGRAVRVAAKGTPLRGQADTRLPALKKARHRAFGRDCVQRGDSSPAPAVRQNICV